MSFPGSEPECRHLTGAAPHKGFAVPAVAESPTDSTVQTQSERISGYSCSSLRIRRCRSCAYSPVASAGLALKNCSIEFRITIDHCLNGKHSFCPVAHHGRREAHSLDVSGHL